MRFYIIAGEASGDLHGSNLIHALKQHDASADVRCWGGDKMQSAGGSIVRHIRDLAFMGFSEVLMNLRTIFRNLKFCKEDIKEYKPDALILIDYPGFNLRIAKWAKEQRIKVIYYISPQVWAWKEGRVRMMKSCIDKMLVILPFEKEYFRNKWNWEVDYVGHPLVEEIEKRANPDKEGSISNRFSDKPIVAVLPGSRKQEIARKLPVMLEVSRSFPGHQFIIAQAPSVEDSYYDDFSINYSNVSRVKDQTYDLLTQAKAAMVTSGTATLETALFGVPELVCYKASPLSYQIGKRLIKVKFISLVNLIMDKKIVNEFIQRDMTAESLTNELNELLNNEEKIFAMKAEYARLKKMLSYEGNASGKAASLIYTYLKKEVSQTGLQN
jgi:lipid-A-disaccharide synthase